MGTVGINKLYYGAIATTSDIRIREKIHTASYNVRCKVIDGNFSVLSFYKFTTNITQRN